MTRGVWTWHDEAHLLKLTLGFVQAVNCFLGMHEDLSLIHGTHIKSRPGVVLEILVPEKQEQKNPVGQLTWPDGLALAPSATLPQTGGCPWDADAEVDLWLPHVAAACACAQREFILNCEVEDDKNLNSLVNVIFKLVFWRSTNWSIRNIFFSF